MSLNDNTNKSQSNWKNSWLIFLLIPFLLIAIFLIISFTSYKNWNYCDKAGLINTSFSQDEFGLPLLTAIYDGSEKEQCRLTYGKNIYVKSATYSGDNIKVEYYSKSLEKLDSEVIVKDEVLLPIEEINISLYNTDSIVYGPRLLQSENTLNKPEFIDYIKKVFLNKDYLLEADNYQISLNNIDKTRESDIAKGEMPADRYVGFLHSLYQIDKNILKYDSLTLTLPKNDLFLLNGENKNIVLKDYAESEDPYTIFLNSLFLIKYVNTNSEIEEKNDYASKALEMLEGLPSVFSAENYTANKSNDRRYECTLLDLSLSESEKCGEKCSTLTNYFTSMSSICKQKSNPTCDNPDLLNDPMDTVNNLGNVWSDGESYWGRKASEDLFIKLLEYSDSKNISQDDQQEAESFTKQDNNLCRALSVMNKFGFPLGLNQCIFNAVVDLSDREINASSPQEVNVKEESVKNCNILFEENEISEILWYAFTTEINRNNNSNADDGGIESNTLWLIEQDEYLYYEKDESQYLIKLTQSSLFYIID